MMMMMCMVLTIGQGRSGSLNAIFVIYLQSGNGIANQIRSGECDFVISSLGINTNAQSQVVV